MTGIRNISPAIRKIWISISAIVFSGISWYLSIGLYGDLWFLLWIAPVPVLILSFNSTGKQSFVIAFLSCLIGRLSWLSYLISVMLPVPAVIITLFLSLIFALIVVLSRYIVLKTNSLVAVFAFPVLFVSYEFMLMMFSYDGSAGSIAYTQSDVIPLIQIASVTGITGITFIITLIPSALACSWYYRFKKKQLAYLAILAPVIVLSVFIFGYIRISSGHASRSLKAGIVVLDENVHNRTGSADIDKEKRAADSYANRITMLASKGAEVILLPERAIDLRKESEGYNAGLLGNAAEKGKVFIISGYSDFRTDQAHNSARVINAEGRTVIDYNKVHLVRGLENQFVPGSGIGLFKIGDLNCGVAVCKDLDYPEFIRKYGESAISFLFVPAWDFVRDDWLHSRMAVLRGVENGFSEVRGARLGRLTISDCFGRVTSEASCSNGKEAALTGEVSLERRLTLYTRFGDWFGITCLVAAIFMILNSVIRRRDKL
jgi:apolipoprotein N-acyltransferase